MLNKKQVEKNFPDWNNGYIKKTLILRFMIYPGQFENVPTYGESILDL